MQKDKIHMLLERIGEKIKSNIRFATLNMLFILAFITVFQTVFGAENSIVGVIFAILMSASMVRDLTGRPLKHLFAQAMVLVLIATAACAVATLPPLMAWPINFAVVFFILYVYTYEYASHIYFPYILSYLFLVFISPIAPEQLPKRLLSMLTGAVCVILYQLYMGRNRAADTAKEAVAYILGEAEKCIACLLSGEGVPDAPEEVRRNLCKLSRLVEQRRKSVLCCSEASFAMLDTGRGLEHLILLLYDMEGPITPDRVQFLQRMTESLQEYDNFIAERTNTLTQLERQLFLPAETDRKMEELFDALVYIREHLLMIAEPERRGQYPRTLLSLSVRLREALNVSAVRVAYALRVGLLLSVFTLVAQTMQLPHGKWLLFTIASVSLPYANDVGTKAKKRLLATVIGGLITAAMFAAIPSMGFRTAVLMLSGYISFYFSDYQATFACSTVGALGSAMASTCFSVQEVGQMFLIRLGYIIVGILIAWVANCVCLPFTRERASQQLWERYTKTCALLTRVCQEGNADTQLYYNLVIQAHLQEEKLCQNSKEAGWEEMQEVLRKCRQEVRQAHRKRELGITNR